MSSNRDDIEEFLRRHRASIATFVERVGEVLVVLALIGLAVAVYHVGWTK